MHAPAEHVCVPQDMHIAPPLPHSVGSLVPGRHCPVDEQQPVHEVESHAHTPAEQCRPEPHVPVWHFPPHPSSAPHAFPVQLGVHPHWPLTPPPPHVSGAVHVPVDPQQGCAFPPHAPQVTPHVVPAPHTMHAAPPWPQSFGSVPARHAPALEQHPVHELGSHRHAPFEQCRPAVHVPERHVPEHPSLAPHAFPVQLGVHTPVPHTFCFPPAPHDCPGGHPPQGTWLPQRPVIVPHLPAQSAVSSGTQASWFDELSGGGDVPSIEDGASVCVVESIVPPASPEGRSTGSSMPAMAAQAVPTKIQAAAKTAYRGFHMAAKKLRSR
jgi:hypothetical protein